MAIDLFVFDLDGTLIDSRLDLALSVNAVRENFGMPPLDHEIIFSHVGNGAPVLIQKSLGPDVSVETAEEGLEFFYSYYREHMLDNTVLYPGVQETLDELLADGKQMAVLTNKPVRFSQGIIDGLGLSKHFLRVYGGNSFDSKKPDPAGLRHLMKELGVPAHSALMVGDSYVDVQTARNAGVPCCGVTYGLQPESFREYPPDLLVDRLEDLPRIAGNGNFPGSSLAPKTGVRATGAKPTPQGADE
jgi:phosphoglycolate phosphatase